MEIFIGAYQRAPEVNFSEGCQYERLRVDTTPAEGTSVSIGSANHRRVVVSPAPSNECSVANSELVIVDEHGEIEQVDLESAHLGGEVKSIRRLSVSKTCRLSDRLGIEVLDVLEDSSLAKYHNDQGAVLVEQLSTTGGRLELRPDFNILATRLRRAAIHTASGSTLQVRESGENLVFSGAGTLNVLPGGWIDHAHFEDLDPRDFPIAPILTMGDSAVLRRASGTVRLGDCMNAQIDGDPQEGFVLCGLVSSGKVPSETLSGAVLRSVAFPVSLAGLPLISAAQDGAAVVVPHIGLDLPGQRRERGEAKDGNRPKSEDNVRADFASSLARLAETKGAPPSITTKLAWLDYRMRLSQARGAEWVVLVFYRCLGFGERFWPCAFLYLILSCTFATLDLQAYRGELSFDSVWDFFLATLRWAAGPIHLVSTDRPTPSTLRDFGPPLGRVVLTVVFGTAVLALRKYVKRSYD